MDALTNAAYQLKVVADSLIEASAEINHLRTRCDYLESQNANLINRCTELEIDRDKNNQLKKNLIESLQESLS